MTSVSGETSLLKIILGSKNLAPSDGDALSLSKDPSNASSEGWILRHVNSNPKKFKRLEKAPEAPRLTTWEYMVKLACVDLRGIYEKMVQVKKLLSKSQFDILYMAWKNRDGASGQIGLSAAEYLVSAGLLSPKGKITPAGVDALGPYKVTNAVIMAAGKSSRFAPLSFEKPKGLIRVKGEVMIERQILQLQAAGICDITLVVGYKKEKMFYLADKFHVKIVVNDDYYRYNNPSSLIRVADQLDNTYICSSDDYFSENVFEPYVYAAYYPVFYVPGRTDEYCAESDKTGRITKVTIGGTDAWAMVGHVYFSREFSRAFVRILKKEYSSSLTKSQLWEDLFVRYLPQLEMYARRFDSSQIKEFDSLNELREFDSSYVTDADSQIFRNIGKVLSCRDQDITDLRLLKGGLTNLSFVFLCRGGKYVYRHPGTGTEAYLNRAGEACSTKIARELGLDDTVLFIDPEEGWKISRFIEPARTLDCRSAVQTEQALKIIRTLHRSGRQVPYRFDLWIEIGRLGKALAEHDCGEQKCLKSLDDMIARLHRCAARERVPECLCHCDCCVSNFLIGENGKMNLIDWERSGMSDPACDLGALLASSGSTMEQAETLVKQYLRRRPERQELCRCFGYAAASAYCRLLQEIVQGMVGPSADRHLDDLKQCAEFYGRSALAGYRE